MQGLRARLLYKRLQDFILPRQEEALQIKKQKNRRFLAIVEGCFRESDKVGKNKRE